jgi:hypothetical protein
MSFYLETALKQKNQSKIQTAYFKRFKGKPFWIPDKAQHEQEYDRTNGKCCFWHLIGLPQKEGRGKLPLFDYEWDLYQAIEKDKYVWVKKSAGLGISTFMLYYIAYKSITSELWKGKQVVVITGPRIELAITLIQRLKALFPARVLSQNKETVCDLAGVHIEAFPSHNLDAARGLEKPICIWLDEGDYFPVGQQDEARVIAERYIGKSPGMSIVMTSTPNKPEGLYETIEKLLQDQCLYHRMVMTYQVGLGKIYTPEEIAKARESPSFPREYEGQYIGQQGDVFGQPSIQQMIDQGVELHEKHGFRIDQIRQDTLKIMGIDAGWGSSKFGIVIVQVVPHNRHTGLQETIQVVYAQEHERPDLNEMVDLVVKLKEHFVVHKVFIDNANPEIVRPIKARLGDRPDYEIQIAKIKQNHRHSKLWTFMNVVPVSFREEGREMLAHAKRLIDGGYLAIHPNFNKLLVSLRTATATDGLLDKQQTSHDDLFDAFRLSLKPFNLQLCR